MKTIREAVIAGGDEWLNWFTPSADSTFLLYLDVSWEDQLTMRKHDHWRSKGFTPAERIYWFDDL